ncbi:hypothetical protein LJR016_005085 [Devosia sp. LjRoot16]|nr:hypothetical protein [Devosia sp. Root105]
MDQIVLWVGLAASIAITAGFAIDHGSVFGKVLSSLLAWAKRLR